jgi:hypothetical protein
MSDALTPACDYSAAREQVSLMSAVAVAAATASTRLQQCSTLCCCCCSCACCVAITRLLLLQLLLQSSDGCSNSDNTHPSNVMRSPHGTPSGGVMGSTLSWLSFDAHSTCSAASRPPGDYNMFALVMINDDCYMFAVVMIPTATLSKDCCSNDSNSDT